MGLSQLSLKFRKKEVNPRRDGVQVDIELQFLKLASGSDHGEEKVR